jgi:cobalt-zinc-cadmium efflux system membrane fusion protein
VTNAKLATGFASCLLALSIGAGGCSRTPPPAEATGATVTARSVSVPSDSPMLKQMRRERVTTAELATDEVIAPGKIEADPNRVSKVVAPVAGRVASVLVRVGDAVRRDQPLFTIDSPDADAAMAADLQAQAALTQARASLIKAEADSERATDLFEHNAVAKKDALSAENALAQAKAAVDQAEATRQQARRRLSVLGLTAGNFTQQVVVRSPLAGKVLELSIVPGEFRNDTNAAVMTIADLSTVWVSSQVPETYIRFIQPKERVEVSLIAYPGEVFEGHVARIADIVDPTTRTVKVQAVIDNREGRFRPDMFGSIHHIESTERSAVVPPEAVVDDQGRSIVFVESSPGQFDERVVVVGKKAGRLVRIVSGVKPGETIVVDGAMLLSGLMRKTA